jgi:ABC-type tungstate transport system substrate-binding protein
MTTPLALETSKGYLGLALGLGFVLLLIVVAVNASLMLVQTVARQAEG